MAYAKEILGVSPWPGCNGKKGQLELFQDIGDSVKRQLEGDQTAPKVFWVPAGHGVGKTYGGGALVNWFFDSFTPSITMTTAPTADQVELLLWKNIKTQRASKNLPGRVLPDSPKMTKAPNHFAYGRTTSDAGGQGTSRVQGQHDDYLFFVLDEAEGIPQYVFDAVDAMMTGGKVVILLIIGNPQTRSSPFFKKGREHNVMRYRLSVLDFPNVVYGEEVVKGGTRREWANAKILKHCDVVTKHNEDEHTFEVAWDVPREEPGEVYPAGTIFMPDAEFMFRVLGIAPKNLSGNTLVTPGRYEAACERVAALVGPEKVRYGVDVARDGDDVGTIYRRWRGVVSRIGRMSKLHTGDYLGVLKDDMLRLKAEGAIDCEVRVDAGGGWGSGIIDGLKDGVDFQKMFHRMVVHEVHNNGEAYDQEAYADQVTEMYAEAGEALKVLRLEHPPEELEQDLTERLYKWAQKSGVSVKKLEEKAAFKKRVKRSPDDGDGLVLCVAPDHIFAGIIPTNITDGMDLGAMESYWRG